MRQLILAGVCALSAVFVAVKLGALAIAVLAVGALSRHFWPAAKAR